MSSLILNHGRMVIVIALLMSVACAQGVTHSGRFSVSPKGSADEVDTLYSGKAENMIVTITLFPASGDKSSMFLVANGADVAELIRGDEDSRTFKLQGVKILTVRFGTQDPSSSFSGDVVGEYTISLVLNLTVSILTPWSFLCI